MIQDVTLTVSVCNKQFMKRPETIGWFSMGQHSSGEEESSHWNDMIDNQGEQVWLHGWWSSYPTCSNQYVHISCPDIPMACFEGINRLIHHYDSWWIMIEYHVDIAFRMRIRFIRWWSFASWYLDHLMDMNRYDQKGSLDDCLWFYGFYTCDTHMIVSGNVSSTGSTLIEWWLTPA